MSTWHFFPIRSAAAAALALILAPFAAAQNHLILLDKTFEQRHPAGFGHGFFFAPDRQEIPGTPMVFLFNSGGSVRQRVAFKRDGMVELQVAAVAPAASGAMVVSLAGMATTGRRDFELAWIDPAGRALRSISTYPFAAELLYVTPSGEVWAGGHEITPEITLQKGRDILRHYSPDGRLIGSCLNLDAFPPLK